MHSKGCESTLLPSTFPPPPPGEVPIVLELIGELHKESNYNEQAYPSMYMYIIYY